MKSRNHAFEMKERHIGGFGGRKGNGDVQKNKNIDRIINAYLHFYQFNMYSVSQGL